MGKVLCVSFTHLHTHTHAYTESQCIPYCGSRPKTVGKPLARPNPDLPFYFLCCLLRERDLWKFSKPPGNFSEQSWSWTRRGEVLLPA